MHRSKGTAMLKINEIKVEKDSDLSHVLKKAGRILGVRPEEIRDFKVLKKSVDARKKDNILEVYSVLVSVEHEDRVLSKCKDKRVSKAEETGYRYPEHGEEEAEHRPVVIGFGPAGIFTALVLAHEGYRPLVFDRGKSMEERAEDVERFFETGVLDPDSNVQFGEGGAGTFSDGKLSTGIKDREGRKQFVLETFIRHGADPEIAVSHHPHIGTDRLRKVIPGIRKEIEALGGSVSFGKKLEGFIIRDGRIRGIQVSGETVQCEDVFLCTGHSARDTYEMLFESGIELEAKPVAVGVRAQHKREMIDKALGQEGASYKLTYNCRDGRGVYSFCMCPGGYVINASSEEGHLTVNGMSYSGRDGENSNSAIVCTVGVEDYRGFGEDALCGMRYLRELERKAYLSSKEGEGFIPCQRYGDFKEDLLSEGFGKIRPQCKGRYGFGNIRRILPEKICNDIIEAMPSFGQKIEGFDDEDTVFSGIEARTSSPVRVIRGEDMQSPGIMGLYPVGEGAGYAGGIMSAAIDGMKAAEKYIKRYR